MIKKKKLSIVDIILFTFSAIFVIDSFGLATTYGWSSMSWWLILGVLFFIPYGLVIAELGSTFSKDGSGITGWIKKAFGKKTSAIFAWLYWINVAFWMPSVYLVLSDSIIFVAAPNFFDHKAYIWISMFLAIGATWLTIGVNFLKISDAKWLPNASAIIKGVVVFVLLLVFFISLYYSTESKTVFDNGKALTPKILTKGSLGIIGIIVYNLAGFELNSNLSSDMKKPKKSILSSIFIGGTIVLGAYLLVTFPVLFLVDVNTENFQDTGYVYAVIQAINSLSTTTGSVFFKILGWFAAICIALTLFGNMITWTLGANQSLVESADNKDFPKFFTKKNKNNAPTNIAIVTGIISTITVVMATFMIYFGEGSLWETLFSFSLVIFLIPYLFIFWGFIKLRKTNFTKREFKVGPNWFAYIIGFWLIFMTLIAIILQYLDIYVEDGKLIIEADGGIGGWWGVFASVILGILTIVSGILIINYQFKQNQKLLKDKNKNVKIN